MRFKKYTSNLALRTAAVYILVSVLWITFSDSLVLALFSDPEQISLAQTIKGWFFVILSGLLILALLRRDLDSRRFTLVALREAERRHKILLGNLPGMVYSCLNDEHWTMQIVSEGCRVLTGYAPEDLIGNRKIAYADLIFEEDRPKVWERVQHALEKDRPFLLNYRISTADGELKWVWEKGRLSQTEEGEAYLEGFIMDVSEQVRLETSLEDVSSRFEALYQHSQDAIFFSDASGKLVDVNPAAAQMIGYQPRELLRMDIDDILPAGAQLRNAPRSAGGKSARHQSGQATLLRKDGSEIVLEYLTLAEVLPGLQATIAHDVTERVRAEARVEREVKRLAGLKLIDDAIISSLDLGLTLDVFLEQVTSTLKIDAANVLRLNPISYRLESVRSRGFFTDIVKDITFRMNESYAGKIAMERLRLEFSDVADPRSEFTSRHLADAENIQSYWGVPLIAKGAVLGVLEIFHRHPLHPDEDWYQYLDTLAGQAAVAIEHLSTLDDLQRANTDLFLAYETTLRGWARALEIRDRETQGHTERVTELTVNLARELGVEENKIAQIRWGARLHDIGKMGIPDSILFKPGPLTDEEWEVMHQHPVLAYQLLAEIRYLSDALEIPYCHHEKWDGSGYPRGLREREIPLSARIFTVVDVWDALRHDRPYRSAWPSRKALDYIQAESGKHFDPEIVKVFVPQVASLDNL